MEKTPEKYMVVCNPYITQMDKFASSLIHLSDTFLKISKTGGGVGEEEVKDIYEKVRLEVCDKCEKKQICDEENGIYIHQMVYEIMSVVEDYGIELNTEMKRKLQKRCIQAPRFLREVLEGFQAAKQELIWNNRMMENREGCAVQLNTFAGMISHATRELGASIFSDEHLEKRIRVHFRKMGIRLLSVVFLVAKSGKYEIHVTVKAGKGSCIATGDMVKCLAKCVGRKMELLDAQLPVIGSEYHTFVCIEGPDFYTLQGVAKIGKGCDKISGDNFSMLKLPGGKEGVILSDGMGAGLRASKESQIVVEMLEELLDAGFPKETALQMLNMALVMGREEIYFSTVDMTVFDLYQGSCEMLKAGASATYIKRGEEIERIVSSSLPLGVISALEPESVIRKLEHGDFIVMITDGVLDALPVGRQDELLSLIIKGTTLTNPKEIAHHILEQVLECSGESPLDDMTVLVVGIWKI